MNVNYFGSWVVRVMIVAGGTGGHLFPALRLAEEIVSQKVAEVLLVTSSRKNDIDILKERNINFKSVPVIALQSRGILAISNFSMHLVIGTIKSLFLLLQFRPSVVIGFGGYVSGPILLWASLFRMKTIIHEQNVYPGKANRILANFVGRIAISFPETAEYFKRFRSKVIVSGNILRKGLSSKQKSGQGFTILAMGGSQGAHALNKLIPDTMGLVQAKIKLPFEIIHISGEKEKIEVERSYQDKGIDCRVFSFTQEMDKLYSECDFVIARAGATTIAELLQLAKPSILIPYPYGNAHQRLNARVLEQIGSAVLLEEKGLTPETLQDVVIKFMDRNTLNRMSEKAKGRTSADACKILLKEMMAWKEGK